MINPHKKAPRRGRLEIIRDVLETIQDEEKPTRVMYGANLSWKLLDDILLKLENRGLINIKQLENPSDKRQRKTLHLTPHGKMTLMDLKKTAEVWTDSVP